MKIHEYQAKQIFDEYGINTPKGLVIENNNEIDSVVEKIGLPCVIKAQVYSGARGKAGGVKLARTREEAKQYAKDILSMEFKSIQTGGEIKKVNSVLVEQGVDIDKEIYVSITMDRASESLVLILSPEGGMNIEEIAVSKPDSIFKEFVKIENKLNPKNIVQKLNFEEKVSEQIEQVILNLHKIYIEKDCSMIEINPLVITKTSEVIAIDAKMNFDDNALFRHPEIAQLKDDREENPLELEASKYNLNYIKLDGTVGCMVNGAGLAMATMDIIQLAGKQPANFLDVGGGASSENIENAFKILLSDKNVEAVFINIFGGILRCDVLANGLKSAIQTLKTDIPIIVRMEGTNKEEGAQILRTSGLKFNVAKGLNEAIELIKTL